MNWKLLSFISRNFISLYYIDFHTLHRGKLIGVIWWKFQNNFQIIKSWKITVIVQKLCFLNKSCNFSTLGFLQDSLYLGQFLAYIGPLYHFGIVKVCTLSIQIDKRIIIVLEMLWNKTWVQKLLHNPLLSNLKEF